VNSNSDDGEEITYTPVPLSEAYLHHHVVFSAHQKSGGSGAMFGAGTESRGTKQSFPYPYRYTTIEGEDTLIANVHVINTRTMSEEDAHSCSECPCTAKQDYVVDVVDTNNNEDEDGKVGTTLLDSVIGKKESWDECNVVLVKEENPSCSFDTYTGGLRCCEHGEYCLDDYLVSKKDIINATDNTTQQQQQQQQSVFYLRYTLTYTPMEEEIKSLYQASCCDASGDESRQGNIEYDIPKCKEDDEECVHVLETIQLLHGPAPTKVTTATSGSDIGTTKGEEAEEEKEGEEEDVYVDVVYMVGHLHRGGISNTLYFMNGTTLCESFPTYGTTGKVGEIGNEPGYINSMSACTFDPPLRMKTTERIRVVGVYDASEAHTGVMSLFYIAIADVDADVDNDDDDDDDDEVGASGGNHWTTTHLDSLADVNESTRAGSNSWTTHALRSLASFIVLGGMVGVAYHTAVKKLRVRHGNYESIPNEESLSV